MSSHAAIILFIVTMFLATGAVVVYQSIGQDTGAQQADVTAASLEVTHASIHGITNRQAEYLTLEIQGEGAHDLEEGYVSVTTPDGSVQLPIMSQG